MGEKLRQEDEAVTPEFSGPEHLSEGIRPIMACVGTYKEYGDELSKLEDIKTVGENLDYFASADDINKNEFRSAGWQTYIMSKISERPKFTEKLFDCTSLVAVGREAESNKEISFLTHQNRYEILGYSREKFVRDLRYQLEELKSKCLKRTIDVIIAGGHFRHGDPSEYQRTLETLNAAVKEVLGFEPIVVGPKSLSKDDIFLDTQNRRLYVLRPNPAGHKVLLHNEVFKPSDIGEMKKKWEDEESNQKIK